MEQDFSFEPKVFCSTNVLNQQYSRKRWYSYHSSGGESISLLSGGSEDELGDMGKMEGNGSSKFTSDENSGADEALYRKKRVSKNMIHVCRDACTYTNTIRCIHTQCHVHTRTV